MERREEQKEEMTPEARAKHLLQDAEQLGKRIAEMEARIERLSKEAEEIYGIDKDRDQEERQAPTSSLIETTSLVPAPIARERALAAPTASLRELANTLLESGMAPRQWNTPAKILAVMETARELGVPPLMAMKIFFPIGESGQLGCMAQGMLAIALNSKRLETYEIKEYPDADPPRCDVMFKRTGMPPYYFSWSEEDTIRARLQGKDTHSKYPRELRKWRAVAAALRVVVPDVLAGLYAPEEFAGEPDYGTLPSLEIVGREVITADIHDWMDFAKAAKAQGQELDEALFRIGCKDIPAALSKYGSAQKAYDALVGALEGREDQDRRKAVLEMVADIYGLAGWEELPEALQEFLGERLDRDATLTAETFPVEDLIDKETGEFITWEQEDATEDQL